ncbi:MULTISPECIES: hypothetical protein [unclassified Microbacterium]|uniref:hypothetical protein n=1 Tax=unclassified Microbacterium TaxID=2609290 RepID=UPI002468B0FC|nr:MULTISPECIES: hypothetical protein [unclassified Microbacterium]MDH5132860.1 hypothetical protein [Microbacterium sp. RD10]MDH5136423.1 hypothetical protein [Microbacterium sp. RD11]MDH5145111.1 hypothetical protein [Microbacterium sp. RD12]MDH5154812.1 hypothetical protein [Microbacterium sp. RD06]MDH5164926.1 hypothetical protein [Microbacterium sp. RD02]
MSERETLIERISAIQKDAYLRHTYLADEHVGHLMGQILTELEGVAGNDSEARVIERLRGQIEEARMAWWSATEQGDNGLVYTDKIEDAMDDIWSAIGHADWEPED